MALRSTLLLAGCAQGFLFEFKKDPVPQPQSYWILGEVTVTEKSSKPMIEKSMAEFDIKTVLEEVKEANDLEAKMKDISVGITESWVMDNLSKDLFCCGGENKENGCAGTEFSLASTGETAKYKQNSYSVSLAELSNKEKSAGGTAFSPVRSGSYYFWIANCAKDTDHLKVAGTVKVKSAHGFLAPESLMTSSVCFAIGFVYIILSVVFMFYPFSTPMKPLTYTFAGYSAIVAIRLLVAGPYAESQVNVTGVEEAGRLVVDVVIAAQCCVFFLLWDMLNSQYTFSTPSTVVEKGVMGLSCLGIVAVIMGQNIFRGGAEEGRPPASFFESAKKGLEAGAAPTSVLESWGLTMTDLYYMGFLLVILLPILTWTERKESILSESEFSKRVLGPLRSKLMLLIVLLMLVLIGFDFAVSKTKGKSSGSSLMLELSNIVDKGVAEVALLLASVLTGYYLASFDLWGGAGSASAYGKVSQDEVELGAVEAEVEDYDPDKLTETRVRLE